MFTPRSAPYGLRHIQRNTTGTLLFRHIIVNIQPSDRLTCGKMCDIAATYPCLVA
jgi:hypothetical protein